MIDLHRLLRGVRPHTIALSALIAASSSQAEVTPDTVTPTVRTPAWQEFLTQAAAHGLMKLDVARAERACLQAEQDSQLTSAIARRDLCLKAAAPALDGLSFYADKPTTDELNTRRPTTFGSIGMEIGGKGKGNASSGGIYVIQPLPGSPAEEAGIVRGDSIEEIDGVDIRALPMEQAIRGFRGVPGSTVTLGVMRGQPPERITVRAVRRTIAPNYVKTSVLNDGDALYVQVRSLGMDVSRQLAHALSKQLRQTTSKTPWTRLVLDLRYCSAGEQDEFTTIAALLLPAGYTLGASLNAGMTVPQNVTVLQRSQWPQTISARISDDLLDKTMHLPLIVLVDQQSAGWAEMLSQALQRERHALVIGEPSAGADINTDWFPLSWGGSIRLPINLLMPPPGKANPNEGLRIDETLPATNASDIGRPDRDPVLARALSVPLKDQTKAESPR